MCFSQQADVYPLHPKYPTTDDEEEVCEASLVSRYINKISRRLQVDRTAIFSLKRNVVMGNPEEDKNLQPKICIAEAKLRKENYKSLWSFSQPAIRIAEVELRKEKPVVEGLL